MNTLGSLLLDAAFAGEIGAVKQLIAIGVDVNWPDEELGDKALHRAAMEGHVEIMRLLMDNGADINAADAFGERPLHYAADAGHMEAVRQLIERGAQVNAVDSDHRTAADSATSEGHAEIARFLRRLQFLATRLPHER